MPSLQLDNGSAHVQNHILDSKSINQAGTIRITSTEVVSISDHDTLSDTASSAPSEIAKEDAASIPTTSHESTTNDTDPTRLLAIKILQIIRKYGLNYERNNSSWDGMDVFIDPVAKQIERSEPVLLLLPGFPFKSPNSKDKVLGALPDLGEEFALKHLNGLCEDIAATYEHGAEVHICSDGLVYNDLLGVSPETVWEYGEAVRQMAIDNDLHNLKFIRLWDVLDHPGEKTKEYYVAHASCIRRELLYRYGDVQFQAGTATKPKEDASTPHKSFIDFVSGDLAYNPDHVARSDEEKATAINNIARAMVGRWTAFGSALMAARGDYVRLSIHEPAGKGKLSMSLNPQKQGGLGFTPWHSCIAVELDGNYRTVHVNDVQDTHQLVYRNGRPSFFRAKSDNFNWIADGLNVTFKHLYPCGLIIRPVTISESNPSPSIADIPMQKVRHLSNTFSPIVLRGFSESTNEELFKSKAHELGQVLVWPQYGIMAKVKDAGKDDKNANNVTSNEAMPMHFDGIFKYKDVEDPETGEIKKVLNPPGYQLFTCIATAPKGSGYTLFCSSRLFFRHLAAPWSVERLEPITWGTLNTGFWKQTQEGLSLVVRHPVTNEPCMRWHEPWEKTKYSTCKVIIENDEQSLVEAVNALIYDNRVCMRFSWEKGDLLVNDNVAMLHTRTAYEADCDREMWRIHFD